MFLALLLSYESFIYFTSKIFSLILWIAFSFSWSCFFKGRLFNIEVQYIYFLFATFSFGVVSEKVTPNSWRYFLLRVLSFEFLHLGLWVNSKLIFVQCKKGVELYAFACGCTAILVLFVEKTIFPHRIILARLLKINWP